MTKDFDTRLFTWLSLSFIVATVVGTLTHEFGHYVVAKYLGYDATIHFASTSYNLNQSISPFDDFWFLAGGPLETMLTGTIGVILLFLFRQSFERVEKLSFRQWVLIFISLFWLRQTANFIGWGWFRLTSGSFSSHSDEIILSEYLDLPDWTISAFTALLGAIVLAAVIFRFVPIRQRLTFVASGLVGGISGYVLWLVLLGKYLIP